MTSGASALDIPFYSLFLSISFPPSKCPSVHPCQVQLLKVKTTQESYDEAPATPMHVPPLSA